MEIYQWLVPLICLYLISRTVHFYRTGRRSLPGVLLWTAFWLIISIFAMLPNKISFKIAELLGFKSNVNAIIFVALGGLTIFNFYLSARVEKLERQLTELVRKNALEKNKDEDRLHP